MYGLRTSPKAWQEHLAQVLKELGLQRLVSEPNVYKNIFGTLYVMVYVDDLLFLEKTQRSQRFSRRSKHKCYYDQQVSYLLDIQPPFLEDS